MIPIRDTVPSRGRKGTLFRSAPYGDVQDR